MNSIGCKSSSALASEATSRAISLNDFRYHDGTLPYSAISSYLRDLRGEFGLVARVANGISGFQLCVSVIRFAIIGVTVSSKPMPAMQVSPAKSGIAAPDQSAPNGGRSWYFSFFLASGFCSILYELIWLRLAMAQFGVTTPMVSIVLSSFMAGLGAGSLAAGNLIRKYGHRLTMPPLQLYAAAEILIGCPPWPCPWN